jgi:hypothetical protein
MMPVEVELYTSDHVVQGQLETAGDRLSDILNNKTESTLILREARTTRLLGVGREPPSQLPLATVGKDSILFAIPVGQRDLTHKSIYRRAVRQAYEIVIFLPNFELRGMIHLTERLDVRRVFLARSEDYIALTHATATYVLYPTVSITGTIIFNKNLVSFFGQTSGVTVTSPR